MRPGCRSCQPACRQEILLTRRVPALSLQVLLCMPCLFPLKCRISRQRVQGTFSALCSRLPESLHYTAFPSALRAVRGPRSAPGSMTAAISHCAGVQLFLHNSFAPASGRLLSCRRSTGLLPCARLFSLLDNRFQQWILLTAFCPSLLISGKNKQSWKLNRTCPA